MPESRFDKALIVWSGVLAQAVVGVPAVAVVVAFGYTRFDVVNELLGMLGGFSLFVAALNLLPFRPLDGATAFGLPWR